MMKHKRMIWVLSALSLVMIADMSSAKGYDATKVQALNTDLVMLTISSFKQVNEQMKQCTHERNCDK
jgi:mannose/fructose-specific phosphotransferase system component IIA